MAFQFADVLTEIEAARLLTYNAARLKVSSSFAFSPSVTDVVPLFIIPGARQALRA